MLQGRTSYCCHAKILCLTAAAMSVLDLFLHALLLLVHSCQVAMLIHSAITCCCAPLTGADLGAVAEGLKVLLLLSTCAAAKGEAAQVCSIRSLSGCCAHLYTTCTATHLLACGRLFGFASVLSQGRTPD